MHATEKEGKVWRKDEASGAGEGGWEGLDSEAREEKAQVVVREKHGDGRKVMAVEGGGKSPAKKGGKMVFGGAGRGERGVGKEVSDTSGCDTRRWGGELTRGGTLKVARAVRLK